MFTKKIICPTSLSDSIKEIVGELHGHQIKGISDFVDATGGVIDDGVRCGRDSGSGI